MYRSALCLSGVIGLNSPVSEGASCNLAVYRRDSIVLQYESAKAVARVQVALQKYISSDIEGFCIAVPRMQLLKSFRGPV